MRSQGSSSVGEDACLFSKCLPSQSWWLSLGTSKATAVAAAVVWTSKIALTKARLLKHNFPVDGKTNSYIESLMLHFFPWSRGSFKTVPWNRRPPQQCSIEPSKGFYRTPKKVLSNPKGFYRTATWPPKMFYRTPVKRSSEPLTGFYGTFRIKPPLCRSPFEHFP